MQYEIEEVDGIACKVNIEPRKTIVSADGHTYTIHGASYRREEGVGSCIFSIVFVDVLKYVFEKKVLWKKTLDCAALSNEIMIYGKLLVVPSKWDIKIFDKLTGEIIFCQAI